MCHDCGDTFVITHKLKSIARQQAWFIKWITSKRTLKELSKESGKSIRTLQRLFDSFLSKPPQPQPINNQQAVLLIDGTWFNRTNCLIVYYDYQLRQVQWWRYTIRENTPEIVEDLKALKKRGVICAGATTDGGKSLLLGLNSVYPGIPKQRCLVHIQRLSLAWLTRSPKTQAGRSLRKLCLILNQLKTKKQCNQWTKVFNSWNTKYSKFLKERTIGPDGKRWWYTHKSLRKVRRYILNALPNMFLYLDHPGLPKDTNILEGAIFSPLKDIYRSHRGLSPEKRANFLAWYLYLKYQRRGNTNTK